MVEFYGGHPGCPAATDVYTGAQANAEVPIAWAGRARWLVEFVMGETTYNDDPHSGLRTYNTPCASPPAHANAPGHDHSGGQFGTPIIRPYASWEFGYPDSLLGAAMSNGRAPQITIRNTAPAAGAGEKGYLFNGSMMFWVPGCGPDGAHFNGKLSLSLHTDTAITIYVVAAGDASYSKGLNVGFNDLTLDNKVTLTPGTLNTIALEIYATGTVAADTKVCLCSISINQVLSTP